MSKKILSVRLSDSGLKGVTIIHLQTGTRKNMKFREKHKVDYDAPANEELIGHFEGLKENVIELCNLDSDIAIEDVTVIEARISPDGEFFQVVGKVRSVGTAEIKLTTPRISDDGSYLNWGTCMKKVEMLFAEAKSYITDKKVMNPNQMAIAFAERDTKFAEKHENGLDAMSEEEKLNYAREILTKNGAIVIEQEELVDPADFEEAEVVEEVVAEEAGKVINITQEEAVVIPQAVTEEAPRKVGFGK